MKKVLITGCAGFIGCHLSERFLRLGFWVVGVDNLSRKGAEANLRWLSALAKGQLSFHRQDIRNFQGLAAVFQQEGPFELVVHEAGQVAVTTSVQNPREDFEINALGTFNLLEATRLFSPDAFFEFASTNKVYGGMEAVGVVERNGRYEYENLPAGVSENCLLDFHSPYGCSKGTADQYVRDYSRIYGLRTVVLRQSCIYGTRQFGIEDQGWVAWFTIASLLKKPITIYGDGMQVRDVLWVEDLVEAYVRLFENADQVSGEIFNVGGGPENTMSLLELVHYLSDTGLLTQTPSVGAWRAGDQRVFVANIDKIQQAIAWRPLTSPKQGVQKLAAWAVQNEVLLREMLAPETLPHAGFAGRQGQTLQEQLLELVKS
jgi:CDP-paratose 2-epimerase